MTHQYLTGRRRYRPWYVGDFMKASPDEKLVLEVEVSSFINGRWATSWRDGTPVDVCKHEYIGAHNGVGISQCWKCGHY